MVDILHRVGIEGASPSEVYRALTTLEGISSWWVPVEGEGGVVGGVLDFHFITMRVAELRPDELVDWEVVAGEPEEWIGTHLRYDIKQDGDYTIVLFKQAGGREPVEMMHHCSTKWGTFMLSLKSLIETGTGTAAPNDVNIGNWA